MLELVDDLLRFSQTSDRELKRRELDLGQILGEVLQEMAIDQDQVEVRNLVTHGTKLFADGAMLKVVLVNLLSNAIKFTRTTEHPVIEIGSDPEDGSVHIWVKDNGVGFDAKGNAVVFNAFKRMHRLDQFEGSGVGLAIVQRVVAKHGGETWAEGKLGEGATIHLRIPNEPLAVRALPFAS